MWPDVYALIDIVQSIQAGTAMGVSDGSVRLNENKATHAWIIQAESGSVIQGCGPVDGEIEARTIHHAKLQGQTALILILALIAKFAGIVGGTIATYCENRAVVSKIQRGWQLWRYHNTKGADSDFQAQLKKALHHLSRVHDIKPNTKWVKGHLDDNGETASLSCQAMLNVQMDHATKEAYTLPPQLQTQQFTPVLLGEGCAFYIGDRKITYNLHLNLRERWHEVEARAYLLHRHNLTLTTFTTVHWQSLKYALAKFRPHKRAMAVKALHRHLPTLNKLFKQGRVVMSSLCPCCLQAEETNHHVFCCSNIDVLRQRKDAWMKLWKSLHKHGTATLIEQTWRLHLHPLLGIPIGQSFVDRPSSARGELAVLLQLAVEEQTTVGWDKLLLCMDCTAWKTLQEFIDRNNPIQPQRTALTWMNVAMHQFLVFSLQCWKQRNLIVHGSTKQEQHRIALQKAREKIKRLYADPLELAPHFRSIYEVPLEQRLKLSQQSAEHWLSMIAHQVKVTAHNLKFLLRQHHY